MNGKFVTYYRVSTDKQGIRGLGMDAQREAVARYLNGGSWEVVGEFEEVESGKRTDRPELEKAIALAKTTGAKLLIAKLDRLARNVHFLTGLKAQGVEFVACDMPDANSFTINIMAAVAEQEREAISDRVTASLASIKAKIAANGHHVSKAGNVITTLGQRSDGSVGGFAPEWTAKSMAVRSARANAHAAKVQPTIKLMRDQGSTLQAVADHLNHLGLTTPRGKPWTPIAVSRAENRAEKPQEGHLQPQL